jgi:hypothetical protein
VYMFSMSRIIIRCFVKLGFVRALFHSVLSAQSKLVRFLRGTISGFTLNMSRGIPTYW